MSSRQSEGRRGVGFQGKSHHKEMGDEVRKAGQGGCRAGDECDICYVRDVEIFVNRIHLEGAGLPDPENEIQELLLVCKSCLCDLSRKGLLSFSLSRATKLSVAYLEKSQEPAGSRDAPGCSYPDLMQGRDSISEDIRIGISDDRENNAAKLRQELLEAQEAALEDTGDDMVKLRKKLAQAQKGLSADGNNLHQRGWRSEFESSSIYRIPDGARSVPTQCAARWKATESRERRTSSVVSSDGTAVSSPKTSKSITAESATPSSSTKSSNWRGWGSPFMSLVRSKSWTYEDDEAVHVNGVQAGWDINATDMSPPRPKSHSSQDSRSTTRTCSSSFAGSGVGAGGGGKTPLRSTIPEKVLAFIRRPRRRSDPDIGAGGPSACKAASPKPSNSGRRRTDSDRHEALIM
jgi:hypothetical protein